MIFRNSKMIVEATSLGLVTSNKASSLSCEVGAPVGYCQLGAGEAKLPRAQPCREYTSAHEGNTSRIAPGEEGVLTRNSVLTGRETLTAELAGLCRKPFVSEFQLLSLRSQ